MEYTKFNNYTISKITLGTAQLGQQYGIANKTGQPTNKQAFEILEAAYSLGINCLDSSPVYGDGEKIIGEFIEKNINQKSKFIISTKLPRILEKDKLNKKNLENVIRTTIQKSLSDLKIKKIPFFLLHDPQDMIIRNGEIFDLLEETRDEGLIDFIGVSVYLPAEVELALNFKSVQAIQAPINVFDQRLNKTRLIEKIKSRKIALFGRSIFLQGLFFLDPSQLPQGMELAKEPLETLHLLAEEAELHIPELCFVYIRDQPEISSLVIGAETSEQVIENTKLINAAKISNKLREKIESAFNDLPIELINPVYWNKKK